MVFGRKRAERFFRREEDLTIRLARAEAQRKEEGTKRGKKLTAEEKLIRKSEAQTWQRKTQRKFIDPMARVLPYQVQDFSFQEKVLKSMFGRGDHIWGTEMEPVHIDGALMPRSMGIDPDDDETARIFGF